MNDQEAAEHIAKQPKPRELLLDVCSTVACSSVFSDYRFLKSKRKLANRFEDLQFAIYFQPSKWNRRGVFASLSPGVRIDSERLKNWRIEQEKPLRNDGFVTGGMIHNTLSESVYRQMEAVCEWDFADPAIRSLVIDDMVAFLSKYTIPYFAVFKSPETVILKLINDVRDNRGSTSIPGFDIEEAVEYALCFGEYSQAQLILARADELYDGLADEVPEALAAIKAGADRSEMSRFGGYAITIAELKMKYGL